MRLAENKKCNLAENGLEDNEQRPSTHVPDPGGAWVCFYLLRKRLDASVFLYFVFPFVIFLLKNYSFVLQ